MLILEDNVFNIFKIVYNNIFREYNYYLEKLLELQVKLPTFPEAVQL